MSKALSQAVDYERDALRAASMSSALKRAERETRRLREQLSVKQARIADLESTIRLMRSRVETAEAPFGKGMEVRFIISAFELVDAVDPHGIIDLTIDKARHDLHMEVRRLGLDAGRR